MKWTREEAWSYLDQHYYMDKQKPEVSEQLIDDVLAMDHYPGCRTLMYTLMPNYGSDCTCLYKFENPNWYEELIERHES
jgi:hypothetical protein